MKSPHKRELALLIVLLIVFSILFIIGMLNFQKKLPVFSIGLPYYIEDLLIIVLSFLSIIRIFWAIIKH
jgi:hypothetical protein